MLSEVKVGESRKQLIGAVVRGIHSRTAGAFQAHSRVSLSFWLVQSSSGLLKPPVDSGTDREGIRRGKAIMNSYAITAKTVE